MKAIKTNTKTIKAIKDKWTNTWKTSRKHKKNNQKQLKSNKMPKIKKEQLEKINKQQAELQKTLTDIGMLEAQKHAALHSIANLNEVINNLKKELEEEYGKVNIDLSDGSYEPVKQMESV